MQRRILLKKQEKGLDQGLLLPVFLTVPGTDRRTDFDGSGPSGLRDGTASWKQRIQEKQVTGAGEATSFTGAFEFEGTKGRLCGGIRQAARYARVGIKRFRRRSNGQLTRRATNHTQTECRRKMELSRAEA